MAQVWKCCVPISCKDHLLVRGLSEDSDVGNGVHLEWKDVVLVFQEDGALGGQVFGDFDVLVVGDVIVDEVRVRVVEDAHLEHRQQNPVDGIICVLWVDLPRLDGLQKSVPEVVCARHFLVKALFASNNDNRNYKFAITFGQVSQSNF